MSSSGSFHGREQELASCLDGVADTSTHRGVVVVGRLGMGKSRLVREVADRCQGPHELIVATPSSSTMPFGCFSHLLGVPGSDEVDERDLLTTLRRLRLALAGRGGDDGLLVIVDDAHHLDSASATLVAQLAITGEARLLLGVDPDAPRPAEITELWLDERCRRVELTPLSEAATGAIATAILGAPVGPVTVTDLHRVSAGNPLFLREVIEDARAGGRMVERDGTWRWVGVAAGGRLRDLVAAHLDRMDPEARSVLDLLAVADPLPLAALVELCGPDPLEHLERAGMIELFGDPLRVHVVQPLVTAVLAAGMGVLRKRGIELALAPMLASSDGDPADLVRGVRWSLHAGTSVDADTVVNAGVLARRGGDLPAAEELLRAAIEQGAGPEATVELAEVLELQARPEAAWELLSSVERCVPAAVEARRRACAIRVLLSGLHDLDRAASFVRNLEPLADERWDGFVEAQWLTLQAMSGATDDVRDRALDLAGGADAVVGLRALPAANLSLVAAGRLDDAVDLVQSMVPAALDHRDRLPAGVTWVALGLLLDLLLAGRHDEADVVVGLALADRSSALPGYRAFILLAQARASLQRGDATAAHSSAAECAALWSDGFEDEGFGPVAAGLRCAAAALLGDDGSAEDARRQAEDLMARSEPRVLHLEAARLLAWAPLARGDAAATVAALVKAADASRERHQRSFEVLALHDAVRLGASRPIIRRLATTSADVQGPLPQAAAAHARALLAGSGADLEQVAARFDAIGSRLVAAEVWNQAAEHHQRAGLSSASRRCAAASRALRDLLGPVVTPGLVSTEGARLSPRELQVARLAAAGMSNREIAATMDVSKRTVDNQLASAYRKLGVAGREELATLVGTERPA